MVKILKMMPPPPLNIWFTLFCCNFKFVLIYAFFPRQICIPKISEFTKEQVFSSLPRPPPYAKSNLLFLQVWSLFLATPDCTKWFSLTQRSTIQYCPGKAIKLAIACKEENTGSSNKNKMINRLWHIIISSKPRSASSPPSLLPAPVSPDQPLTYILLYVILSWAIGLWGVTWTSTHMQTDLKT